MSINKIRKTHRSNHSRALSLVTPDYMMTWNREEPLPLWPGQVEARNEKQVEYHERCTRG